MLSTLAVVPARGGSKGIPLKNIREVGGKPLIAYNLIQAKRSRTINRLVVSTDHRAIADVAKNYGAEVVWRPSEISGDKSSSESALIHTLEYLEQTEGYQPDLLLFLQCTSPLTLAEDMDGAVEALIRENADTALTVVPFHYFLWRKEANGNLVGINHEKSLRPMRQDREPQFLETGSVYVMKAKEFRRIGHRFFGKTVMHVIPEERRLEIDEPFDLEVAEIFLKKQKV